MAANIICVFIIQLRKYVILTVNRCFPYGDINYDSQNCQSNCQIDRRRVYNCTISMNGYEKSNGISLIYFDNNVSTAGRSS
jgi:hypothetical protein